MKEKEKKVFFDELAAEAGYVDPETTKSVYIGMVRLLLKKLRYNGEYDLPDFGKYSIVNYSERNIKNVNTGQVEQIAPVRILRFSPDYKLKAYVKKMRN